MPAQRLTRWSTDHRVYIGDLDRAQVLAALFNAARGFNTGLAAHWLPNPVSVAHARVWLDERHAQANLRWGLERDRQRYGRRPDWYAAWRKLNALRRLRGDARGRLSFDVAEDHGLAADYFTYEALERTYAFDYVLGRPLKVCLAPWAEHLDTFQYDDRNGRPGLGAWVIGLLRAGLKNGTHDGRHAAFAVQGEQATCEHLADLLAPAP